MPNSGFTTIIIFKTSKTSSNAIISYSIPDEDDEYTIYDFDDMRTYVKGQSDYSGADFADGNWNIMSQKWESSSGDLYVYQNGDQERFNGNYEQGEILITGGSIVIGHNQLEVDANYEAGRDFVGGIAEIIMFSSSINEAQVRIIENYLSEKYSLALATAGNDVYGNDADYDATYYYHIAGIGQEASGDHTETNSGGLYLYERNTTLDDGEYIMLGHDNATNSSATATKDDLTASTEKRWARDWYIETTGGVDVKLIFDFDEALTNGEYPTNTANYTLLYRATNSGNYSEVTVVDQGIVDADQLYFDVADANLLNGYYTLGSNDTINSPVEGSTGRTWYVLASGDWNTWEYWTLDPSGALPNNPGHEIPAVEDKVVIHTGKTITIPTVTKSVASITVEGILDIGTTTGHNFTEINGNGRIRLAGDNFPLGDATHFVTAGEGEGTVVFQGGTYSLADPLTFFDVEVNLDLSTDSLVMLNNLTLNGSLVIEKGILKINRTGTDVLTLDVAKDVTIESAGEMSVGSGDSYTANLQYHQFVIGRDFTNNGTANFTNRGTAGYTTYDTGGAVEVIFNNTEQNQSLQCNGPTVFNQLTCNKGVDKTYILEVAASSTANFEIYGKNDEDAAGVDGSRDGNKALRLLAGTLKLGSNIDVSLAADGGCDIDSDASLWLDNNASATCTDDEIYLYGELKLSGSSTFTETTNDGIELREQGVLNIEGGTHTFNSITISTLGAAGSQIGAYIQSGGDVTIADERNSSEFAPFHLAFQTNVFQMSGGTLRINDDGDNDGAVGFALIINSSEGNYNVTGGTITIYNDDASAHKINSRAPLWNLILKSDPNGGGFEIDDFNENPGDEPDDSGDQIEDIPAQPLVVLNDFTIDGSPAQTFTTNDNDVYIGGDFIIENGATYTSGSNTTKFIGSGNSDIIIGATTGSVGFYNLEIDKDQHSTSGSYYDVEFTECVGRTTDPDDVSGDNTIIQISNNLTIERGQFSVERYTVGLDDTLSMTDGKIIYNASLPGRVSLNNGSDPQIITGSLVYTPNFGNIELDNSNGATITTNADLENFILTQGIMDIGTNRFSVDTNFIENGNAVVFSVTKMIQTDADHGAKGLRLKMDDDYSAGGTVTFPVGSNGNWTKLDVIIDNAVGTISGGGYLTFIPVDLPHPTRPSGGCDAIDAYWRSKSENLSSVNSGIQYDIYCPYLGVNSDWEMYFMDGTWTEDNKPATPTTLHFESDDLDGFPEEADFTVGKKTCFNQVSYIYSNGTGGGAWNAGGSWAGGTVPQTHDYAYIVDGDIITVNSGADDAGKVIVDVGGVLDIGTITTLLYNIVNGGGKIRIASNTIPDADFDNFMFNDTAIFEFYGTTSYTLPADFPVYPNLIISGSAATTKTLDAQDILVRKNLYIDDETLAMSGGYDLYVLDSIIIDNAGVLQFPNTGAGISDLTVNKSIDLSGSSAANTINILIGATGASNHNLYISEDIVLNSNSLIDLYDAVANAVDINFVGDNNSDINDGSGATLDFNRIIIDKSVSTADVSINEDFNLNGATNGLSNAKALYLVNGALTLNNSGININLSTGDSDFKIPSTTSLEIVQGTVNVSGDENGIWLDGKLTISGGTVNMDDTNYPATTDGDNYIEYSASGNAEIEISGGTLTVGSQIRRSLTSEPGNLKYTQTGGAVSVGVNSAPEGTRGVFEILNEGSSFVYKGGDLYISNAQSSASIASFYLDPETDTISTSSTIYIGDTNTGTNQEFGIYSIISIPNLTINNNVTLSNPLAKMWTVPLSIDGELNIESGAKFDANGLDLNLYGDFTNSGTFTASQNTTYFKGTSDQAIDGNTTFYNLINQNTTDLNLTAANADIIVANDFTNELGSTINDNSNDIFIYGDIDMSGTHVYDGAGDGITLKGSEQQSLTGNGTFGKLTINNGTGINLPVNNELTIINSLKMISGVFDIGGNLLTLNTNCIIQEANPFGENNMIKTNVSFTDNGVKKIFPSGALPGGFIYPLGAIGKYTPVEITISTNTATGTYLIAKGADEIHPSITDDAEAPDDEITDEDNVLQYYWVLTANGFTDLDATIEMYYDTADVEVTTPYDVCDYVTARLLNDGTGNWLKYDDVSKFDEANTKLIFDINDAVDLDITGDYTAGVDGSTFNGAIPDQVPLYQSNGTSALLDWHTADTWRVDDGTGTWVLPATMSLPDLPRGARVRVLADDTVQTVVNYISAYTMEINGTLDVGTTFGNRTGVVTGTGILYTERGSLPAGYYESFFSASGGTIEFGGSTDYSVLSNVAQVNNLTFSGTGLRELPNLELTVIGNMLFSDDGTSAPDVVNEFDEDLLVGGNITFNAGTFDAGSGTSKVAMNGSAAQTISGNNSFTVDDAFWNFELNNSNGVTLNIAIDIDLDLTLTSGIITTTTTNILSVTNTGATVTSSSSNYVDGPMRKNISTAASFMFPVGDGSRYGEVEAVSTASTGDQYWEVEYFNANPHATMDTSLREANLEMVSGNEYWRVEGPAGDSSKVRIRWDDQSLLPAMTSDRGANMKMVEWSGAEWQVVDGAVTDGGVNSGTILSDWRVDLDEHYFTLGTYESAPLPTATFTNNDTSICAGQSVTLSIDLTGETNWSITVEEGGDSQTFNAIAASPYTFSVDTAGTYTLTAVSDNGGAGYVFGPDVTVTIVPLPINTYNVTGGGSYCSGGSGVVVGLDGSETGVTYELFVDAAPTGSTTAGDGAAISFGNQTAAGTYTVEGTKDANTDCSILMTGTTVTVTINPLPVFVPTATNGTICFGETSQLDANYTEIGVTTYLWSPSGDLNSDNVFNPVYDPSITGTNPTSPTQITTTFTVTVTDGGCSDTGTVDVVVNRTPETGPQYHISNDFAN